MFQITSQHRVMSQLNRLKLLVSLPPSLPHSPPTPGCSGNIWISPKGSMNTQSHISKQKKSNLKILM